jgi:hypothetical protein
LASHKIYHLCSYPEPFRVCSANLTKLNSLILHKVSGAPLNHPKAVSGLTKRMFTQKTKRYSSYVQLALFLNELGLQQVYGCWEVIILLWQPQLVNKRTMTHIKSICTLVHQIQLCEDTKCSFTWT